MSLVLRTTKGTALSFAELDGNFQYLLDCCKGLDGLDDPGADRLLGWDDSQNTLAWQSLGAGLRLSDNTLSFDTAWGDARYYTQSAADALYQPLGNYQPLDGTLTALANLDASTGLLIQSGADAFARRTLTAGTGISITNGNGVSGNPTLAFNTTWGDARYYTQSAADALFTLPTRLGATAQYIADWNDAASNGWFMANNATNAPETGWVLGHVVAHNAIYVTQYVHKFTVDSDSSTQAWMRSCNNGTWSSWWPVLQTQTEMDERYYTQSEVDDLLEGLGGGLSEDTTVTFASSNTAAEIQSLIDAQPKNLNGYTLTFQFGDGSYTLNNDISFDGFFGGIVCVSGNSSDNTAALSKTVVLNFSGTSSKGLSFTNNSAIMQVYYVEVDAYPGTDDPVVYFFACKDIDIQSCAIIGTNSVAYGIGMHIYRSDVDMYQVRLGGVKTAVLIDRRCIVNSTDCRNYTSNKGVGYGMYISASYVFMTSSYFYGDTGYIVTAAGGRYSQG